MRLLVDANVELKQVESVRGPAFVDVAVILNDVRCGFSKRRLIQVYESCVRLTPPNYAVGLKSAQEVLSSAENVESLDQAQSFLSELVVEAVKSSSERVITLEVTDALLAQTRDENPALSRDIKKLVRSYVTDVLRHLTKVHISVHDATTLVQYVVQGESEGFHASEVAERLIDRWRPRAVEIHIDPVFAEKLLKDDPVVGTPYPATSLAPEPRDVLGLMYDGLFYELGVWLPSIKVVVDPELPNGFCRFRMHERLTPMLRGIAADELLVNDIPDRLKLSGITDGQPRMNPANGNPCSVISTSSQTKLLPDLTTWDQLGYMVLLLAAELRSAAPTLLSLNDVEDLLGKLNDTFPELLAVTFQQYRPLDVAQVLRWVLRDGVSVRDLRSVLELMLDFSYTTGIRAPTSGWEGREPYVYVGNAEFNGEPYFTEKDPYIARFDIGRMQLFAEPALEWVLNGRILAEFVKCGLRRYLTHKLTRGEFTILSYLLDADIEMRLQSPQAGPGKLPFSDEELAQILKAMSEEFVDDYRAPILFLATTPDVALLVQDMISQDFPEVNVLHRQSVEESASVQPIARVPGFEPAVSTS
ncbi:MAG TPA: FHIPEP family type III secretion protein [Pyrinomonadaceae bacterium]|nr:FHIPEP family type III secretion protein [Pyrinomonadaceae bacterium]